MKKYKNIIFDYGGVFIRLCELATYDAFQRLGVERVSSDIDLACKDFQRGKINTTQFCDAFKPYVKKNVSSNDILNAWRAMLIDLPKDRINLVKTLKEDYKLILLSNTDSVHIEYVDKNIEGVKEFKKCFSSIYYSHLMGLRKPDPQIFKKVLEKEKISPKETLFVDDLEENTEAAQSLGINVWHLDLKEKTVLDIFEIL